MDLLNRHPFTPISSVYGRIEELIFVSTYEATHPSDIIERFQAIWKGFDHHVQRLLLARYLEAKEFNLKDKSDFEENLRSLLGRKLNLNKSQQDTIPILFQEESYYGKLADFWLNKLREQDGPQVQTAFNEIHLQGWAQDPFVVLESPEGISSLLEPMFSDRTWAETFVGDQIAAKWGTTLRSTKFNIEGGNILADQHFVFLGADILFRNIHFYITHHETCASITEKMGEAFGKRQVCWVGVRAEQFEEIEQIAWDNWDKPWKTAQKHFQEKFHWQPFFHLDLYLTLGGWKNGDYLVFLGDYHAGAYQGPEPKPPAIQKRLDALLVTKDWFQYIGEKLNISFKVVAMPMLVQALPAQNGNFSLRSYNFNNVLVEIDEDRRNIYFPKTTRHLEGKIFEKGEASDWPSEPKRDLIDAIGLKARAVYTGYEFTIRDIDIDYRSNSREKAGIHCLLKVLKRRRFQP